MEDDIIQVDSLYDANNNMVGQTETYARRANRTSSYAYDDFDRLITKTDTHNKTVNFSYDLNGNRIRITDPDGILTSYEYDGLNRVQSVRTAQGVTQYTYDRDSRMNRVQYPNNTTASYTYDRVGRTTAIINRQNGAVVSGYDYQYDQNSNRTQQTEVNGGPSEVTTYEYDTLDRLTNVTYPDSTVDYTYDLVYNRLSERVVDNTNTELKDWDYQYNERHQLTDIVDRHDTNQNIAYTFDPNGNQTSKTQAGVTTDFLFDARDHIRQVLVGGSSVGQFLYDPHGLRIEKIGDRGVERYTYDDLSVLLQYNGDNNTVAKFDWGPDRLLSLNHITEGTQFYLTDVLGSVVNLTHKDGSIQARYQYDAWGNRRNQVGDSWNRFAFTGHEEDTETGLLYAKARFYDPDTGRFLSQDAWEGDLNTPPSLHKYLYAYQNPTVYVDPDGNMSVTTMIDNSAEGCGAITCGFYALGQAVYQVGTLGFAAVHDPVRDEYDRGNISGEEYITSGIGGGTAAVVVTVATGRVATPFLVGANTTKGVFAVGAATGVVEGASVDAITQSAHISAGIQGEYNLGQTARSAVLGGLIGGGSASTAKYINDRANVNHDPEVTAENSGGPNTETSGGPPNEIYDAADDSLYLPISDLHNAVDGNGDSQKLYGPFHRAQGYAYPPHLAERNDPESLAVIDDLVSSNQLLGKAPHGAMGDEAAAQAHVGALSDAHYGVEFYTSLKPKNWDPDGPAQASGVRWTAEEGALPPDVPPTVDDEWAGIPIVISKVNKPDGQ